LFAGGVLFLAGADQVQRFLDEAAHRFGGLRGLAGDDRVRSTASRGADISK
jgi:hypothetical protein